MTELNRSMQCFVGTMSTKRQEAVPKLMSYMVAIIRASEDYAGLAWARL